MYTERTTAGRALTHLADHCHSFFGFGFGKYLLQQMYNFGGGHGGYGCDMERPDRKHKCIHYLRPAMFLIRVSTWTITLDLERIAMPPRHVSAFRAERCCKRHRLKPGNRELRAQPGSYYL